MYNSSTCELLLTPIVALGFLFTTSYPNIPETASTETEQRQVSQSYEELVNKQLVLMLIYWYCCSFWIVRTSPLSAFEHKALALFLAGFPWSPTTYAHTDIETHKDVSFRLETPLCD